MFKIYRKLFLALKNLEMVKIPILTTQQKNHPSSSTSKIPDPP